MREKWSGEEMKKQTKTKKASPQKPPFNWIDLPFRLETFKKTYLDGSDETKKLLETGYREFVAGLVNAEALNLPDTFGEMLDKEKGYTDGNALTGTFPKHVYSGTFFTANHVWEDTETAREIIEQIDKGDLADAKQKPPRRIFETDLEETPGEISDFILDGKPGEEDDFSKRIMEKWIDVEFLANPRGRLADMLKRAKKAGDRAKLAAAYRGIVEKDFNTAAQFVADKTGAKLADVTNPKKRTAEQSELLLSTLREYVTDRINMIYDSNFVGVLMEILHKADTVSKMSSATVRLVAKYAALYFFALHPEIDLRAADALKEEEREEAKAIYDRLLPFMEKELKAAQKRKEFLSDWQAFKRFVEAETPVEAEQEKIKDIVRVAARSLEKVDFSIDKLNANAWSNPIFSKPTFGEDMQLNLGFSFEEHRNELPAVDMASKKDRAKGKVAPAIWGIRFDFDKLPEGVTIPRSKELDDYDRHVHDAVLSLYRAGAKIVSLNSIYHAMGRSGTPGKDDRDKINMSLTKMRSAIVYIDTSEEVAVNKSHVAFHYDGALLPFERATAIINGKETKTAIKVLEEPPLGRLAGSLGQCTKFPLSVWGFSLRLTNTRLRIAHYLAEYIAHLKNKEKLSKKLTLETIFERCGAKTKMQKSRCRKIVKELIEYWRDDCDPVFLGEDTLIEKEFVIFDVKGT